MELETIVNGVKLETVNDTIHAIEDEPELAKCNFRITNRWISGGHNQATVRDIYGAKQEIPHHCQFDLDEDEPELLAGTDQGPNPAEYLLTALSGCMTSTMVYHAALRGIHIESMECEVDGDLDMQGFLGIDENVKLGYSSIRVRFRIETDEENLEKLKALTEMSPIYDTILNGTNIDVQMERK
ncbi:MAG: OsmC family protein [Planctomycetota bacterium]|jgi:uncharacterized OsmC-like protein